MRTLLLLFANLGANTGANICLKCSAIRADVKAFLFWQALGNLLSFLGVLAYTVVLKKLSLHVACPLTEGLTAVRVQVVVGLIVFRERISVAAWAGAGLIVSGIVLFSL